LLYRTWLIYIHHDIRLCIYLPKYIANYGDCDNEGQSVAAVAVVATMAVTAAASLWRHSDRDARRRWRRAGGDYREAPSAIIADVYIIIISSSLSLYWIYIHTPRDGREDPAGWTGKMLLLLLLHPPLVLTLIIQCVRKTNKG